MLQLFQELKLHGEWIWRMDPKLDSRYDMGIGRLHFKFNCIDRVKSNTTQLHTTSSDMLNNTNPRSTLLLTASYKEYRRRPYGRSLRDLCRVRELYGVRGAVRSFISSLPWNAPAIFLLMKSAPLHDWISETLTQWKIEIKPLISSWTSSQLVAVDYIGTGKIVEMYDNIVHCNCITRYTLKKVVESKWRKRKQRTHSKTKLISALNSTRNLLSTQLFMANS